jgi:hypothetical protein
MTDNNKVGKIWCRVCQDWIDRSTLRRWTGDDRLHYLCPGCDSDMVFPVRDVDEEILGNFAEKP